MTADPITTGRAPSVHTRRTEPVAAPGSPPGPTGDTRGRPEAAAPDRVPVRHELTGPPAPQRRVPGLASYEDSTRTQLARRTGRPPGTADG
ncbi:hypothetical protein [Streptomyces sp. NPDC002769]|uniref:hypothetical protein n=1 Tax=Streptomyces sp. NPDC002769 TaxID=3154542 RepID=UPI00331F0F79